MDDEKQEKRETADEPEVDDLDLDEAEAEDVKGGSAEGKQTWIKYPG
jgi:hypothetical protein